jgi:hypothetical protein
VEPDNDLRFEGGSPATGVSTGTGAAPRLSPSAASAGCLVICRFGVALLLLVPQTVWAHAIVLKSTPAVNAVLSGDDVPIRLRFNSQIDVPARK